MDSVDMDITDMDSLSVMVNILRHLVLEIRAIDMSSATDLLFEYDETHVGVRQATKTGFILCEVGGGSRPFVSIFQTSQR